MENARKLFRAMAPVTAVCRAIEGIEGWPSSSAQAAFVEGVLRDPAVKKFPPSASFVRAVLKSVVASIGNSEAIDDGILETLLGDDGTSRVGGDLAHCSFEMSPGSAVISFRLCPRQLNPVGLATWPAGFLLAEAVLSGAIPLDGLRVLELGSGVGVTGIALARWSRVASVCLSDFLPSVLENLSHNVEINGLAGRVRVQKIDWEETGEEDERTDSALGCDAVIAADCVYDPELARSLAKMIRRVLDKNGPATFAIVANTVRQPETIEAFRASLDKQSLSWQMLGAPSTIPQLFPGARPEESILWKVTSKHC